MNESIALELMDKLMHDPRFEGVVSKWDGESVTLLNYPFPGATNQIKLDVVPDNILEKLWKSGEVARKSGFVADKHINKDYESIRNMLVVRPYPSFAKGVTASIHTCVGDIALVLYAELAEDDMGLVGAKVPMYMIGEWGIPKERLIENALENSMRLHDPRIMDTAAFLKSPYEYFGEPLDKYKPRNDMLCLTTINRINGAAAIFMPGVAKKIGEMLGTDYYMTFTSIHEVMIHSVLQPGITRNGLKKALFQTVSACVDSDDFLSLKVYRYYRDKQMIDFA